MRNYRMLLAVLLLSVLSCEKKGKESTIRVDVVLENFSGTTDFNRNYTVDSARLYLSNFELVDTAGHATRVKDLILVNSTYNAARNSFSFTLPDGDYSKLRFHFGLDPATNNSNPVNFSESHPLSLSQDMYWGMLKYRFLVAECKIDSFIDGNHAPENPFSMHLGNDTLYRTIEKTFDYRVSHGDEIRIRIDLQQLFVLDEAVYNITNFSNHSDVSQLPKGILITDAFVNGFTLDKYSTLPD